MMPSQRPTDPAILAAVRQRMMTQNGKPPPTNKQLLQENIYGGQNVPSAQPAMPAQAQMAMQPPQQPQGNVPAAPPASTQAQPMPIQSQMPLPQAVASGGGPPPMDRLGGGSPEGRPNPRYMIGRAVSQQGPQGV